jgi:hypothetical protein
VISSQWGGRRYPPYAFTEQDVAMLSSVLNSHRAIQVNIEICGPLSGCAGCWLPLRNGCASWRTWKQSTMSSSRWSSRPSGKPWFRRSRNVNELGSGQKKAIKDLKDGLSKTGSEQYHGLSSHGKGAYVQNLLNRDYGFNQ